MPSIREELEHRGFSGFVPFRELPSSNVPPDPGVYVVVRAEGSPPKFLAASRGGHFKGRDPFVSAEELSAAWVAGAQILYVGKAGAGRDGRRGLRKRLDEYRLYGEGRPVGHQGGRYIWQLADAAELLVAWLPTPGEDPGDVEASMIAEFTAANGSRPFANRNRGRRLAPPGQ